jgi:protein SCO1/2
MFRPSAATAVMCLFLGTTALRPLAAKEVQGPGLDEKTGANIPFAVRCVDERGASFSLLDRLDKPAILALVYYSCEHICPQVLVGLGRLVSALDLRPGEDYRLITLSFDADDTPAAAASAKRNYLLPLGPDFPASAWTFATADAAAIESVTRAVGFRFERRMHGFIHPSVLVVLSPGGRISGYVHVQKFLYGVSYPVTFSPVVLRGALLDAAAGRLATAPAAPLLFCFASEPPGQTSYFRLTAILGAATLAVLALLFGVLMVLGKKSKEA